MTVSPTIPDHVREAAIEAVVGTVSGSPDPVVEAAKAMAAEAVRLALDVVAEHLELWVVGTDESVVPVYMWVEKP